MLIYKIKERPDGSNFKAEMGIENCAGEELIGWHAGYS